MSWTTDESQWTQEDWNNLLNENTSLKTNVNELNFKLDGVNILLRNTKAMYDTKKSELDLALKENVRLRSSTTNEPSLVQESNFFEQELQKKLSAEIISLETELEKAKKSERLKVRRLKKLSQSIESLNMQLNKRDQDISDLQSKLGKLKSQQDLEQKFDQSVDEKTVELQKSLDEKEILEIQFKKANTLVSTTLLDNQSHIVKIQQLEKENQKLQISYKQFSGQLGKAQSELKTLQGERKQLDEENQKLKATLENEIEKNKNNNINFANHVNKKKQEKTVIDEMNNKWMQIAKRKMDAYKDDEVYCKKQKI